MIMNNLNFNRLEHFNQILNQITGNCPDPPNQITNSVVHYLNLNKMDYNCKNIKLSLRQLKLEKYYEFTQKIYLKLNNLPRIQLDTDIKNQLDLNFLKISRQYLEIMNPRKSFLSYYFILYKLLQFYQKPNSDIQNLIEMIPKISGSEKQRLNNEAWEKICSFFDWTFFID